MLAITPPYSQYFDLDGSPLDAGYLYFGQASTNPETTPISVYWDAEGAQPAAQPVRTLNGYPMRNGTPAQIFCDGAFSITVRNKRRAVVTTAAQAQAGSFIDFSLVLAGPNGAGMVSWLRNSVGAVSRTLSAILFDVVRVKDFGAIGDGVTDDTLALQKALTYCASLGRPITLILQDGKYKVTSGLVLNATLNNATLVRNITIKGARGHRAYDQGDDMSASISASGTIDTVLDMRATQACAIIGVGFYAPTATVQRIVRFGSEGVTNPSQISRVLTIEDCRFYGAQRCIDGYLTSGFRLLKSNVSRGLVNGVRLNACGDWEIIDSLINNIGPILTAGIGANYYDGAGLLAYGGGGNNNYSGGKIEVCSKGMLFDNVQGVNVGGVQFDKCKEFALAIGGNTDTAGKTQNLGNQPRSFSVSNCRFLSNGWDATYQTHILFSIGGGGNDLELGTVLTGNTFARGGGNAIDLDMTLLLPLFGAGPYRCIRANNAGTGTSVIKVNSSGNSYSGGSTNYTFESYSYVLWESSGDAMDIACRVDSPGVLRGTLERRTYSFSWTPAAVADNSYVELTAISLPNLTQSTPISLFGPSSLQRLIPVAAYSSAGVGVARLFNNTGAAVTPPSGTYQIQYEVNKWLS